MHSSRRATVWQPLGLRQRIEHAQLLAPEDVGRDSRSSASLLGAVLARAVRSRPRRRLLGGQDATGAYAFRSLLDSGAVVANGRDAPIEELDPLAGIRAGVRRTIDERAVLASGAGADRRAGVPRDVCRAGLARPATSGAAAQLLPGILRRPRRARPRSVGRPRRAGRRDDGRRPLGAQPAALGLRAARFCLAPYVRENRRWPSGAMVSASAPFASTQEDPTMKHRVLISVALAALACAAVASTATGAGERAALPVPRRADRHRPEFARAAGRGRQQAALRRH